LAKQYDDLHTLSVDALKKFKQEVKSRTFPPPSAIPDTMPDDEFNRFMDRVG